MFAGGAFENRPFQTSVTSRLEVLGCHAHGSKRRVSGPSEERNLRGYIANEFRPVNKKLQHIGFVTI